MQYSTNYNLNLVEGTDIVNPLVIDKPNYITIDAQMKSNEDSGVGTATEIKTGTVHALTRSNGDNNVFRYVATSVCNAGDTFTVDGVNVTALLPTGEALPNNTYTIGCNVLAILTSTELTIFSGGGTASNAAMLNSQLPSYYLDARNESFDNNGTDLSATNTEAAIKEVNTKVNDKEIVIRDISITTNTAGIGTFSLGANETLLNAYVYGNQIALYHAANELLIGYYDANSSTIFPVNATVIVHCIIARNL